MSGRSTEGDKQSCVQYGYNGHRCQVHGDVEESDTIDEIIIRILQQIRILLWKQRNEVIVLKSSILIRSV